MNLVLSPKAAKQLSNLPKHIQKKAHKQFSLLLLDYHHPSLRSRKMGGENKFEIRIDLQYRSTFVIEGEDINIWLNGIDVW